MIRRIILLSLLLVVAELGSAAAQSSREIARRVFPSVVLLVMVDKNGQPLSQGSGFVVQPNIVVTNHHVIEGATSGFAKVIGKKETYEVSGFVSVDQKYDLALLEINGVKAPSITLTDTETVAVGDKIFAVGNPLGLEGTFSEGIVSGIRHLKAGTLIQITAPISPGSSGGPILDEKGQVIGVAMASFSDGQNLNFAIPASYALRALLKKTGAKPLASLVAIPKSIDEAPDITGKSLQGVQVTHLEKAESYSALNFSIKNLTRQPVKMVKILFVFKDKQGDPVDVVEFVYKELIPPSLAKRTGIGVNSSTLNISRIYDTGRGKYDFLVESRVLDFQFVR